MITKKYELTIEQNKFPLRQMITQYKEDGKDYVLDRRSEESQRVVEACKGLAEKLPSQKIKIKLEIE